MKIYTKTGDAGETGLWGGKRAPKNHPRIEACGEIDELNSVLGLVLSALQGSPSFPKNRATRLIEILKRIQGELFDLGAIVAGLSGKSARSPKDWAKSVLNLEVEIDAMTQELSPLKNFILPGGSETASLLFIARAVSRRAERRVCSLKNVDAAFPRAIVYLNRVSDHLFTAARWANRAEGLPETIWPGRNAHPKATGHAFARKAGPAATPVS